MVWSSLGCCGAAWGVVGCCGVVCDDIGWPRSLRGLVWCGVILGCLGWPMLWPGQADEIRF